LFAAALGLDVTAASASTHNQKEVTMAGKPPDRLEAEVEEIPLGQRLFENPFLLLIAGILVMVIFYTGWGMWEILSLTPAPLP
jgi:hypothetical protein